MSPAVYAGVGGLFVLDAALSRWRPSTPHALRSAVSLALAYVPMLILPQLSAAGVTAIAATIGIAGLVSFARLVGLWSQPRFFVLSLLATVSFFVAARVHWYDLFQAMPVFAMFAVAGVGTVRAQAHTFLQRMCLAWLGLTVYGYLFAHAALFMDMQLGALPPATVWMALILFFAKAGDVLWEGAQRAGVRAVDLQIPVCAIGGAIGAALAHLAIPEAFSMPELALLGGIVGAALAAASRTYKLIVSDVLGEDPDRPMKGTMLFGFAFALALAFHYVRHLA